MNIDTVMQGDCTEVLKTLPDKSINCCVTSPPYYGLRDYGMSEQIGLEETPEEYIDRLVNVFREVKRVLKDDGTLWVNIGDSYAAQRGGTAQPLETLANGDRGRCSGYNPSRNASAIGVKHKDMIGIPWMLAFALRNDGWYLRQDIIWHKPNPMPESVTDRCTKSHEYIFLLSKKPKYYFDHEAIQEPAVGDPNRYKYPIFAGTKEQRGQGRPNSNPNTSGIKSPHYKYKDTEHEASMRQGMNKGRGNNIVILRKNLPSQEEFVSFMRRVTSVDILSENTDIARTKVEHWFRTDQSGFSYPSVDDWNKIRDFVDDWSDEFHDIDYRMTDETIETDEIGKRSKHKNLMYDGQQNHTMHERKAEGIPDDAYIVRNKRDVWSVTTKPCSEAHFAVFPEDLIEPCILAGCPKDGVVLDPFFGSGTTGRVAQKFGRHYVGIELNPEYIEISERRTNNVQMTMEAFI